MTTRLSPDKQLQPECSIDVPQEILHFPDISSDLCKMAGVILLVGRSSQSLNAQQTQKNSLYLDYVLWAFSSANYEHNEESGQRPTSFSVCVLFLSRNWAVCVLFYSILKTVVSYRVAWCGLRVRCHQRVRQYVREAVSGLAPNF
jgi:hypothetical protein